MASWEIIAQQIGDATGEAFVVTHSRTLGGGCINHAVMLEGANRRYFVKLNSADRLDMFQAELAGLGVMADSRTIRVPKPICSGVSDHKAYLVLEYIDMEGTGDSRMAGTQLAAMHRVSAEQFGWERDNTIGSISQPNGWSGDWIFFWRERRIGHQLELAASQGQNSKLQRRGKRLLDTFSALIDHTPGPSLLHGDLWGGNIGYDRTGAPVLFDPALYFGDREADLAMTELFGGFDRAFYDAYKETWPLDSGYPVRRILYNLYHILNHCNMFGGSYCGQAREMIDQLLAELGY
ncbi:MAG: fructosamine kinase family protein [Gammaproteobacteria bacterium]|nr:fructosamine kinase family protein [Gammaproteobacteria bacterium]